MSNKLIDMAHDLRNLKDKKEKLEGELSDTNKAIRRLAEQEIPEYMEENEIEKISIDGVGTLYTTLKIYANVKKENKEAFYNWLREHGNEDMVQEYVFPATLNAFAKEQLNEGKPLPDDLIEARLYPTATLRRK